MVIADDPRDGRAVAVERMRAEDIDAVVAIERESFGEKNRAADHFREEMNRIWARAWVAREAVAGGAGEIRGFLLSWVVADELHVLDVAVAPDARRRGIGIALLRHAFDDARICELRLVLLEVRASNVAALALYERLGFERIRVRRAYYPDGEDGVEMLLRL